MEVQQMIDGHQEIPVIVTKMAYGRLMGKLVN